MSAILTYFSFLARDGTLFASILILPKKEKIMNHDQMLKRISELESINDQLLTEIRYLDQLLKQVGFEEGLKTLKTAAKELIEQDKIDDYKN